MASLDGNGRGECVFICLIYSALCGGSLFAVFCKKIIIHGNVPRIIYIRCRLAKTIGTPFALY